MQKQKNICGLPGERGPVNGLPCLCAAGGRTGNRMFGPPGVCRSLSGLVGLLRDGCNDRLLRART